MTVANDSERRSPKSKNLAWLVALLALDVLLLLVLIFPALVEGQEVSKMMALRASLTALLPVPALLLASLIPANAKASLVFWRRRDPLPGARAFSVHASQDSRIDLAKLQKNVGVFPSDARGQNSKWYSLYKLVAAEASVVDSHQRFLLFRDAAAASLLLTAAVPMAMYAFGVGTSSTGLALAAFLAQYLLAALAARHAGVRFVQTVLAIHSGRKVTSSKPSITRTPTKSKA